MEYATALKNVMTYEEYRSLTEQLVIQRDTTGNDKDTSRIEYTALNEQRMRRLDKTIKILESERIAINETINEPQEWILITESWCGDAAHAAPVISKLAQASNLITLRLVLRDENPELMDQFLTNGSRSIPMLIMASHTGEIIGRWGPRPSIATKMVKDYKSVHGVVDAPIKEELQRWYNKNKGRNIIADILSVLNS